MSADHHDDRLREILHRYPRHPRFLLAFLQDVQREFKHVPRKAMEASSERFMVPMSRVYSVATFYRALSLVPRGRKTIKVCMGTACHLRGAPRVLEAIEEALQVRCGGTTRDGEFSVEAVNCLGACALAPVVMVEDRCYGSMTAAKVREMLEEERGR
ncbi:complex I 24 kDa subunit family protein [Thermanaerovibrio acidaminovorans]|uniref:NADH-quinone oxidoreductase subunit NuoE family protein n=1 Tax=Thermanaerovibrio acidaminovorans TaxID=81462 RepID=UPI00248F7F9A|nr:NAD(P)H-dependent oxidoreductase subunit E [Thermanaerovibrio acidaminovorans]